MVGFGKDDFDSQINNAAGDPFIAGLLQARIESGEYPAGSWLPAERALAEEFAADRYTIRKALGRLEEMGLIVREQGRRPWVRTLTQSAGGKTPVPPERTLQTISAIMGQNTTNLNSSAIVRGINGLLRSKEAPYRLLISDTYDPDQAATVSLEQQALDIVAQEGVAGSIIVHNGGPDTVPNLRAVQEQGIPLVFVDRYPEGMRCDFVGVDNFASAQEAVQHLLDLGHRRIGHLTNQERVTTVLQREEGYRETLRGAGIMPHPEWIYRVEQFAPQTEVGAALDQFFGLAEPPTAVFAVNDALAHYFIAVAEERGYGVPEAISVVGFDNYDRYSPRPPVLTTIDQSFEQIGRRAAELLLSRIAETGGEASPYQHILLPSRLVVRATTRSLTD